MAWETKRIKDVVKVNELTLSESTDQNYEFKYIDIGSINLFKIAETETTTFLDAPSRARRIVRKNDVLVSTVRTYLKAITYIDFEPKDMIASTGFAVMTPQKKINPKFLSYAVESDYFIDDVIKNSVGTSYPAINALKLEALSIILPTLEIQRKIAAFLDSKTQNIDRRIELLQKKKERYIILRKAIINEVVNGDEKDWMPCRLKDLVFNLVESGKRPVEIEEDVVSIGGEHIQNEKFYLENLKYVSFSTFKKSKGKIEIGDILVVKDGATIGKCMYVSDMPFEKMLLNEHVYRIQSNKKCNNKFLFYFILSNGDFWFRLNNMTTAQETIKLDTIYTMKINLPNIKEQDKIANYLDKKTSAIDTIVEKITKEIDALKIYRRALINETVTGKLNIG